MNTRTFLGFAGPSLAVMFLLIAAPLGIVGALAVTSSYVKTKLVEVNVSTPLFGTLTQTVKKTIPQPVLDAEGQPVRVTEFVGAKNLALVASIPELREAWRQWGAARAAGEGTAGQIGQVHAFLARIPFWSALEFTLLYTFVTLPFVLVFGFMVALGVNRQNRLVKGPVVFLTLLPFIITPVVGALAIYWLFLDNAVVSALLEELGFGHIYFLKDGVTIRSLIIAYGVWYETPFAFIVLYAGLQTVPSEPLEAAVVDGATRWQTIRSVIIPHLMPLFRLIVLIHLMDSYRVFEPVLVFGSALFANSLQYLTYYIINFQDNYHLAAASALLTVLGIAILLTPVLRRTWREQRGIA